MNLQFQNGFLIQHLYDPPYGTKGVINTCGYYGMDARISNPLSMLSDQESMKLSKESQWRVFSEMTAGLLEFVSDPNVLIRYIKVCRKHNIPIRLLFVESDYSEEIWTGPDIPKRLLGYEYNTIPIDNQIITDLSWYSPLSHFLKRLNLWGLFPSLDDVMRFKNAYDRAFAKGELGDGNVETHIFCLYEVQPYDVLRCLPEDADST